MVAATIKARLQAQNIACKIKGKGKGRLVHCIADACFYMSSNTK
jgi:hypothetical protein